MTGDDAPLSHDRQVKVKPTEFDQYPAEEVQCPLAPDESGSQTAPMMSQTTPMVASVEVLRFGNYRNTSL